MKICRWIFGFLALTLFSHGGLAATYTGNMTTPFAYQGNLTQIEYYLEVLTPEGVYYGYYAQSNKRLITGDIPNLTWSGTTAGLPIPKLTLSRADQTSRSDCPGIDNISNGSNWQCYNAQIKVTVEGEVHGCPWLISTYIISHNAMAVYYTGPKVHNSSCPSEPLEPYDVSWDESRVVKNTTLTLQSTGGVIERTLSTFLMKDGMLCDGSKTDSRGSYCRFVSQMITFTASGCDNAKVTVTPNRHPITDKQLHDMVVRVDTTALQPIDSTCRFQYVLNMI